MEKIVFKTQENEIRPIINLNLFLGCKALIDSGAEFPVWTSDEDTLKLLPNIKSLNKSAEISGFGGKQIGNLYQITFSLGKLHYIEMPIICCELKNAIFDIILPQTLFSNMSVTINNHTHQLELQTFDNQIVRHLIVKDNEGNLGVYTTK